MAGNTRVKEEVAREINKYFELNVNENSTYQNVWDIVKRVLREMFVMLNAITHKNSTI